jgi:hypothetical protein
MTFNVENFNSKVISKDLLRPSLFVVKITTPACLRVQFSQEEQLSFLCAAAEIPGKQIATQDVRRYGYGPNLKYPYLAEVANLPLTFYIDAKDALAADFLHAWGQKIAPMAETAGRSFNGVYPGEVTYRKDYATTIIIEQFNQEKEKIITCQLEDAFPVTIDAMALDWASFDEVLKLRCEFAYRSYNIKTNNLALADIDNPLYNSENDNASSRAELSQSQGFRTLTPSISQESSSEIPTRLIGTVI